MNTLITISTCVSAIATIAIAYYSYQTKKSQDKFQEQLSDLYKGIIIATLQSANTDETALPRFITRFNEKYDGKTKIFK